MTPHVSTAKAACVIPARGPHGDSWPEGRPGSRSDLGRRALVSDWLRPDCAALLILVKPARMSPALDDLLRPGLSVVFCGTVVDTASADRGHYYSGPGNKFWQLLHEAGFTPIRLWPEHDSRSLTRFPGHAWCTDHAALSAVV